PRPLVFDGQRLPASYANFYIANGLVLAPTFNDPSDRVALATLARLFPDREVCGINCTELIWGMGAVHCMTQQQPSTLIAKGRGARSVLSAGSSDQPRGFQPKRGALKIAE